MDAQSSGTMGSQSSHSGSDSKTTITRSLTNVTERDEDFTKDNAASPVDLECHIQAERITKIIDEAIYKIKLSLCLPTLLDKKALVLLMTEAHYYDLMIIYEQYENPLFSTSLQNVAAVDDLKAGDVSIKNRMYPELGHLIYIMNGYPALRPLVEEMVNEMKSCYLSYVTKPPQPGLEYLFLMEHFRKLVIRQMTNTAAEELAAKIETRKLEEANAKLIREIEELSVAIKKDKEAFEAQMIVKEAVIEKLENELETFYTSADVKLQKQILDSDRQMVLMSRAHAVKYEMLVDEEKDSRESYGNALKIHLNDEKNLRARKRKCETQLQSWLQKYDLEMGDKQLELDEVRGKYDEEFEKCQVLEKKLAEQDIEYLPLMAEREEEYHQELAEKQRLFLTEHAARVIQVCWRDTLANRAEKKKLKKILKKMQAKAAGGEKKGGKK